MEDKNIVLYLHMHQPFRIKPFSIFNAANDHNYFNGQESGQNNKEIFLKVANKSYRPMLSLLEDLVDRYDKFSFSLSISGIFLEQAKEYAPDVIDTLKRLVASNKVEIVGETYYHSLAFFFSPLEFERQVELHKRIIKELFNVEPKVFRNTELAYNNELAVWADSKGYRGILAEGWDPILEWRSPNYVYRPVGTNNIKLLLKNYQLSDDIAFRFSDRSWLKWPLTADKYVKWAEASLRDGNILNLFMDFETFGEHQWEDTGIFTFFSDFVNRWLMKDNHKFITVSKACILSKNEAEISMPSVVTWADSERDLSAWIGNELQKEATKNLYSLEDVVKESGDESIIDDWGKLQASDHPYYMSTKNYEDGNVHAYFSPYESPYDAFMFYMNTLRDLKYRTIKAIEARQ